MSSLLSGLLGFPVTFLRPPTPTRLELGDKIAPHDDMQEPLHCAAVVVNLSKGWRAEFGGSTIVGNVDRVERVPTPPDHPYQVHNWVLTERQEHLPVRFNSLLVLRLKTGVAHGVAEVRSQQARLTLVSNFGRPDGVSESQWHGQEWLD
jgi:Rps23 Pro-64 3,4-dihydroxylase Tpa1-like proline 4-hydroxylase